MNNVSDNRCAELERRVAELEADLNAARRRIAELERIVERGYGMVDAIPAMVYFKDREHRYLYGNRAFTERIRVRAEDMAGKTDRDLFPPEVAEAYLADDERVMATGEPSIGVELPVNRPDGTIGWVSNSAVPYRDRSGAVVGMVGIAIDITERKRIEEELRRSQEVQRALTEQQAQLLATIRKLSTPVLPVTQDALVLPLIGDIDTARSQQITEALLDSVQRHRAQWAIIDITSVPLIDTAVANHLIQATQGIALLGARVILVGVSPELAQTIVGLGVNLKGLITQSDLRSAIAFVLKRSQKQAVVP